MDSSSESNRRVEVRFENQAGDEITFGCMSRPVDHDWTIESWELDLSDMTHTQATVHDHVADLFTSNSGDGRKILMWTAYEDDAAFYVSGVVEKQDLLHVAESVTLVNADDLPEPDGFRLAWIPEGYDLFDEEASKRSTRLSWNRSRTGIHRPLP